MVSQSIAVMRHPRVLPAPRRTPIRVGPPLRQQLPPALRRAALAPTLRRPAIPLTLRRPMIALALRRPAIALSAVLAHGVFALKLIAGVLAAGTVALAIMNNRDVKSAAPGYELASLGGFRASAAIETVVFRRPSTRVQDTDVPPPMKTSSRSRIISARSKPSASSIPPRAWPWRRQRRNPRVD